MEKHALNMFSLQTLIPNLMVQAHIRIHMWRKSRKNTHNQEHDTHSTAAGGSSTAVIYTDTADCQCDASLVVVSKTNRKSNQEKKNEMYVCLHGKKSVYQQTRKAS